MKNKIFIGIIIVLLVLLWGQLFYYNNHSIKSVKKSDSSEANSISQTKREVANATTQIETINDNYDLFYSNYSGPVSKQEFNDFINDLLDNKRFKTLYDVPTLLKMLSEAL